MRSENSLTIVTGCDSTHARSLLNLLASAKTHEPETRVIIYDLGMTNFQLRRLARKFKYEVRKFDYLKYPAYFNIKIDAGEYAWKPVIVAEVAEEFGGIICWMDSGNVIVESLQKIVQQTLTTGLYLVGSGGTIGQWTHSQMLSFFDLPFDWKSEHEMLAAYCVGFNMNNVHAKNIAKDWAKFALQQKCIAPPGSSRANHRQDQALLAVLVGRSTEVPFEFDMQRPFMAQQDADFLYNPILYFKRRLKKYLSQMEN